MKIFRKFSKNFLKTFSVLENAFSEAKIRIDDHKSAEDQIHDILDKLRPVLPIKLETKKIGITIPSNYAGKSYSIIQSFGKVTTESWQNNGSLILPQAPPVGKGKSLEENGCFQAGLVSFHRKRIRLPPRFHNAWSGRRP